MLIENLTRQQRAMIGEFTWPDDPFECTDMGLTMGTGFRTWPTMDNLIDKGLVERVEWESDDEGWLYRLTVAGRAVLAELRPDLVRADG